MQQKIEGDVELVEIENFCDVIWEKLTWENIDWVWLTPSFY